VQQNSFEMIDLCLWILQLPLVSKKFHTAKLPAYRKELLVFDGKQILEIIKTSYSLFKLFGKLLLHRIDRKWVALCQSYVTFYLWYFPSTSYLKAVLECHKGNA